MNILKEYHVTEATSLQMSEVNGKYYVYWYNSHKGQITPISRDRRYKTGPGWRTAPLTSKGIKFVAMRRSKVNACSRFYTITQSYKNNTQFDRDHSSERHLST